jgi:MFS family permease
MPRSTEIFGGRCRHLSFGTYLSLASFPTSVHSCRAQVPLGSWFSQRHTHVCGLTQTAFALPFFVFALPAGAIGDIVDRRKLILYTETWMAGVALVLTILTIAKLVSPLTLLLLICALSAGDAFESPSWRATLPELVANEDLSAASVLNGIEFNFARAVGPGLAGLIIVTAGVGTAFLLSTISFFGVIFVVADWKRSKHKPIAPPETVIGATIAAIRYVRYSPAIRTVLIRTGLVMFCASALLALLPFLARTMTSSPSAYGLLLRCFGLGAVAGALVMQRACALWSTDAMVAGGAATFGLTTALPELPNEIERGTHKDDSLPPAVRIA